MDDRSQSYSEGYPDHRSNREGGRRGGGGGGLEGIVMKTQSENDFLRERMKSYEKAFVTLYQVCEGGRN